MTRALLLLLILVGFGEGTTTVVPGTFTPGAGSITNAMLMNASTTVNGVVCTLGSTCAPSTSSVVPDLIVGLTPSFTSVTSLTVAAGTATDTTNAKTLTLAAAMTKTTAAWVAGTGNGGGFVAVAASQNQHWFLIRKDSDGSIDVGWDTSTTAANIPAGYTFFTYLFSVKINAASNYLTFDASAAGSLLDIRLRDTISVQNLTNPGTAALTVTLNTTGGGCPTGFAFDALITGAVFSTDTLGGSVFYVYYSPLTATDEAAGGAEAGLPNAQLVGRTSLGLNTDGAWGGRIRTNTSAQIRNRLRSSVASTNILTGILGYRINRGNAAYY